MLSGFRTDLKSMNNDSYHFKTYNAHRNFAYHLGYMNPGRSEKTASIAHLRDHQVHEDEKSEKTYRPTVQKYFVFPEQGHHNHYREYLERILSE